MKTKPTVPSFKEYLSFPDLPIVNDLDNIEADVAILGIPFGDPYSMEEVTNDQSNAPTSIRRFCQRALTSIERWDFDVGGEIFDGKDIRVVDVGDVTGDPRDMGSHYRKAEESVRKLLAANVLPIVFGGDHGIPIPVIRAYEGQGPITLIQIDAHLDWRDHMNGVREGYSSPIRRASEMDHIGEIFQIGLRSSGSARREEVEAALAYGAHLIPDMELQRIGMQAVLDRIPDGGKYYITIDADGVDPTIMPAVAGPVPGGVNYDQMRTLIHGLVDKGRVVGMDIVEITPKHDINGITAITAGRFICNLIGKAVRAGYFDK